jgi:uracil-DNA glycosylase
LFDDELGSLDADALLEAANEAERADALHSTPTKKESQSSSTASRPPSQVASLFQPKAPVPTLRHGDDRVESETMDAEWYARLSDEMCKSYFRELKSFLKHESDAGKTIYPPAHLVHSWSRLTPLSTVKVVVVGQDPYHGPGQACGHSFSVPKGVAVPGSLQNIYKELKQEYGTDFVHPKHGCLDSWATQGVLLLNACLTVQASQAGSHHNKGWEPFTQQILRSIAEDAANGEKPSIKSSTIATMFGKAASAGKATNESNQTGQAKSASNTSSSKKQSKSKGVVFLAWGLPAAKTLSAAGITEKSPNVLLLKSAHPSPLSAHRGFLGNGHFKKANEWLESSARYGPGGGIDWQKL